MCRKITRRGRKARRAERAPETESARQLPPPGASNGLSAAGLEADPSAEIGAAIQQAWNSSDFLKKDPVLADAARVAAGKHAAGFLKAALAASATIAEPA